MTVRFLNSFGVNSYERLVERDRLAGIEAGKSLVGRCGIVDVAAGECETRAELLAEIGDRIKAGANAGAHTIQGFVRGSAEKGFSAKTDVAAERDRSEALDLPLKIPNAFVGAAGVLIGLVSLRPLGSLRRDRDCYG